MSTAEEAQATIREMVRFRGWNDLEDITQKILDTVQFTADDFWNGDTWITKVIGAMALRYRDIGRQHPAHISEIEWKSILTRIAEPLLNYSAASDEQYGEAIIQARAALHLFADWFDQFFD